MFFWIVISIFRYAVVQKREYRELSDALSKKKRNVAFWKSEKKTLQIFEVEKTKINTRNRVFFWRVSWLLRKDAKILYVYIGYHERKELKFMSVDTKGHQFSM